MRFSTVSLFAVLAAFARAQSGSQSNPFQIPTSGFNATAGQKLTLNWQPTTSGTVSLVLRSGEGGDLAKGVTIASSIDNSGSFQWPVPSSIAMGGDYTVEIVDDDNPETNTNFTPFFPIDSDVTSSSIASSVTLGAPTTSLTQSTVSPSSVPSTSASTSASGSSVSAASVGSSTASTTSAPTSSESVISTAPGVPSSAASSLSSAVSSSSAAASSSGSMMTSAASSSGAASAASASSLTASASAGGAAAAPTQQAFGGMVAFAIAGVVAAL